MPLAFSGSRCGPWEGYFKAGDCKGLATLAVAGLRAAKVLQPPDLKKVERRIDDGEQAKYL